jgi:chromosome segregation ATPase
VITTVVAGHEAGAADPTAPAPRPVEAGATVADVPEELLWVVGELHSTRRSAMDQAEQLATVEGRLAGLEAVPATIEALGRATRQELERCAGVLFGHDRALSDTRQRLDSALARLDAIDERTSAVDADQVVARVFSRLDEFDKRLAAMEARVEPLEPIPTVVQALRRAVRSSDEVMAAEVSARERQVAALAGEVAAEAQARDEALRRGLAQDLDRVAVATTAQAQAVEELAARLAAAEIRLAPLDAVPGDIEALSRILRRELDAVTSDNQARDQMLRRALQNEIDQLRATSETREQAAAQLLTRLEGVEGRLQEVVDAQVAVSAAVGGRLDGLEGRAAAAEGLATEAQALRDLVRTELDRLQADVRAHDQVMGEITRHFSALDGRLARFDPVPGEVQSLRTAMRQESERSVTQLRGVEERVSQLAWVPAEFQEARKRILALTSSLQAGQDAIRTLETALASTDERVKALGARLNVASLGGAQAPGPPA